ncbi:MAG: cobyric acid synthase [Pseudomonadota bacterium]
MTARALMLQGTGSDVGKSVLTAGLLRLAKRRGLNAAPFKPQNMSNNAAACRDGGEIGRAQALQALAAGLAPRVDFNPVLLKPQSDRRSQVVVQGQALSSADASDYIANRGSLLTPVLESFDRLTREFDLILVEGAGSPAEINLRRGDIANMGFARAANVPVCLVADIERGGVIASLVGTNAVLDPADAALVRGFIVNKFRGDPRLFDAGVDAIVDRTGWQAYGVVPWLTSVRRLPAEDAVSLDRSEASEPQVLHIAAPMLSRMANFDDADPLRQQPGVHFEWVPPGQPLPRHCDLVILFGSKSTLAELAFIHEQGWDHDIIAHARAGGHILGICGGYQLLGTRIHDPDGVDGAAGSVEGLGLLDVETHMVPNKTVRPVRGHCTASGMEVTGYEIHVGETRGKDCERVMFDVGGQRDGAISPTGRVSGTYLHGVFANDHFRRQWLGGLGAPNLDPFDYTAAVESALDDLADELDAALDVDALFAAAAPVTPRPPPPHPK